MTTGWDEASTIAVALSAVATASMAIYTARLARKTTALSTSAEKEANAVVAQGTAIQAQSDAVAAQAEAANDQLLLTQQTMALSVQPWLTLGETEENVRGHGELDAFSYNDTPERLFVSLRVRNVGSGIAIIDPKHSHIVGWPSDRSPDAEPCNYSSGAVANPILPPDGQVRVTFAVNFRQWAIDLETLTGQHRNDGEYFVDVAYADTLGLEMTVARFHVAHSEGRWIIFEIQYFSPPNSDEPRLTVRF